MKTSSFSSRLHRGLVPQTVFFLGLLTTVCHAQTLKLSPVDPDGIFAPDQTVAWNVAVTGDALALKNPHYQIKLNGGDVVEEGTLDLAQPNLRIVAKPTARIGNWLPRSAALLVELTADGPDAKPVRALGGAVVEPTKIAPVVTRPADFDAFWKTQIAGLRAVPANVQLEAGDSGNPAVDYFKVTFDNVDGAKIHAQMARPKVGAKLPAVVIVQWAGVYGLSKDWIVGRAASGWLVLNVMPHDLPIDQTADFYKQQSDGPLKDYASIGNTSRETSYFRHMFLGNIRAADYITSRGDWDGKTLVATGGSQGGYQSVVLAGLDSRFTAVIAGVPAGCDITSRSAGRAGGWPSWWLPNEAEKRNSIIETSRYYDTVNFASRVRVPTLIGMGLIDTTCPPAGVFAMINQLAGPKETVVMPLEGHQGKHSSYETRASDWFKALTVGGAAPVKP